MKDLVSIHVIVFETLRSALSDKALRILFFDWYQYVKEHHRSGFSVSDDAKLGTKKADEE